MAALRDGTALRRQQARALLADANLTAVLMLGPYRPVGVGRTQRTLPAWLRALLEAVHGHCRGPGCDRPIAWAQAAHLHAWHHGGHTSLDANLPLCHAHHDLLDRRGWTVHLDPDTAICTWTSPDGRTTTTCPATT